MNDPSPLPAVTGIVLAGGRARRFGRDKLLERVGDVTLLGRAIAGIAPVTTDIVVVTAPDAEPDLPEGVRQARDARAFEGPLAGCLAGLVVAAEPLVLVVGGDMPTLRPAVLELLIRVLVTTTADACVLEQHGERRPLPMALRTGIGTDLAGRLVAERERRLGAILDRLHVRTLTEGEWRPLDPDSATLRDIDTPEDLRDLESR